MNLEKFSEIVSRGILGIWIPILFVAGLLKTGPMKAPIIVLIPCFIALSSIIPITFSILQKKGKISDWHITKREERHIYFAVIVAVTLVSVILSYYLTNYKFFALDVALLSVALSLSLLTFVFKISGHMVMNTSSVLLLNYLFDWKLMWLFLIVPVVAFARFYLKKHTLFQLLAGTVVGFAEPYLILKLFNLL